MGGEYCVFVWFRVGFILVSGVVGELDVFEARCGGGFEFEMLICLIEGFTFILVYL